MTDPCKIFRFAVDDGPCCYTCCNPVDHPEFLKVTVVNVANAACGDCTDFNGVFDDIKRRYWPPWPAHCAWEKELDTPICTAEVIVVLKNATSFMNVIFGYWSEGSLINVFQFAVGGPASYTWECNSMDSIVPAYYALNCNKPTATARVQVSP